MFKEEKMQKKFKFNNKKMEEGEFRQMMDLTLISLIEYCDTVLERTQEYEDYIQKYENKPYQIGLSRKMVNYMNKTFDSKMEKANKKNKKAIENNDLRFFEKETRKDVKAFLKMPNSIESMFTNISFAQDFDNDRFACELIKFIRRSMTESKNFYEERKSYNEKYLENEGVLE